MPESMKNYMRVTKPGIVSGNLVTAAGGFFLASRGNVDLAGLVSTLIGLSLMVASGCVLNNCVDRDLDRKMIRTCNRVLARGLMSPRAAVIYAFVLGAAGAGVLWAETNLLSVLIVLAGFAIYVGLYSLVLKRHSAYAIGVGSLAGAAPPLAGYCAVTGRFDTGALILLLIFALWQIPHSYAIAVFRFQDYTAAALPVLPVKCGLPTTKRHIIGYLTAFLIVAPMLTFGGYTGHRYLVVAAVAGVSWLLAACAGYKTSDDRLWAKKLFVFSIVNITVLSIMMAIDVTVPASSGILLTYVP